MSSATTTPATPLTTEQENKTHLLPAPILDPIVFQNEIIKAGLFPAAATKGSEETTFTRKSQSGIAQPDPMVTHLPEGLKEGTFKGTQKALTSAYAGTLNSYATYFDIAGFEPSMIRGATDLKAAQQLYNWSQDETFPPHLAIIPADDSVALTAIFNKMRLLAITPLLSQLVPQFILDFVYHNPSKGDNMQTLVDRNHQLRKSAKVGLFTSPNIGDRDDWHTDAVFAQQQLIGTNPVTLEIASTEWLDAFHRAATSQSNKKAIEILSGQASDSDSNDTFYVQDLSWFRKAAGVSATGELQSEDGRRQTTAPVTLFRLTAKDGKLHPLAICIDFKESLDKSIVLFNKRLRVTDDKSTESSDWPWRYAKTVAQCADWHRHEVGVHLTEAHFIEEATIVAANRSFPETHMVYQLLSPHWLKTLSLNAAARSTLVPNVVIPIAGMSKAQVLSLSNYNYSTFDFTARYIPNDLKRRGFPIEQLNDVKFHNCAYARDIILFWNLLRKFVATVLHNEYSSDANVASDDCIAAWCEEMQNPKKGDLKSFPTIKTVDELIDAVTACIHIASPGHSSINYLQNYYYSFVISKPPALYAKPPTTLDALRNFKERDLMEALPVNQPREWLLASHIPWLLSYQVAEAENVVTWAASLANATSQNPDDKILTEAARVLYQDMLDLAAVVKANSEAMDDQGTPYTVLTPKEVAVSILI